MGYRILLICTGNTCRSAMGEGILRRMLKEVGRSEVEVSSAGTGTCPGWEASREATEACREMQVDITRHRSQPITLQAVREADLILAMQRMHADRVIDLDPSSAGKVRLLGEFDEKAVMAEISDPVGMPLEVFRKCADRLFSALRGVVQKLSEMEEEKTVRASRVKRVAIGADHRGYPLKQALLEWLKAQGCEVADCGSYGAQSADHPEQAFAVGELVRDGKVERGVLICSNGIGMAIAANKVAGVYAALVHNEKEAKQARNHNGANVICLSGEDLSPQQAQGILETFLTTETLAGENDRYQRRRDMIQRYEEQHWKAENPKNPKNPKKE